MQWLTDLAIWMPPGFIASHPSVRLRRLNLRKPLRNLGVRADFVYRKEDLQSFQNVLISHYDAGVYQTCKELRAQGKTLYYDHTEQLWGFEYQTEVFNACDYIICCSTALAEFTQARLTSPFTRCVVIPDMAEGPFPEQPIHQPTDKEQLIVNYTGMGGNSYLCRDLKPIIEKVGMKLVMITEHDDADIKWNRDTYLQDMAKADIAICPQNFELQPCKSNVKLSLAMAVGLPTISSPLRSYKEIVKEGENGFIAKTAEEWEDALLKLKDFTLRKKISEAAWKTGKEYWPENIAAKYLNLLLTVQKRVIYVNNTLPQKYLSYGDRLLETLRFNGRAIFEEYRYEDIDCLPEADMQIFVEVRYDPTDLPHPITTPRVLITKENQDINNFAHFNIIITPNEQLAQQWTARGFVNVYVAELEKLSYTYIKDLLELDITARRQLHNLKLHDAHINAFHHLIPPEERWSQGERDKAHIAYTIANTKPGDRVLDIGSADGWLSLYLAKHCRNVSALEFVERGMDWTRQHAERLGVKVDLRKGFVEEVSNKFKRDRFDAILLYEICEHLDYWRLPFYLMELQKLLAPSGKLLISVPSQSVQNNDEHLWTPTFKLVQKMFKGEITWVGLPGPVPGNWFIKVMDAPIQNE